MIGKITKLASFRTIASYLLREGRGRVLPGCPMVGRSVAELVAEADPYLRMNPKLRNAVAHFSLSPSPDDPPLSDEQWQAIAQRFMAEMGFGEAAWTAVLHNDSRVAPLPAGAVPAGDGLNLIPLVDDADAPPAVKTAPVVGPMFRNFRERLQERRERVPQTGSAPQLPRPPKHKPFG